MPGGVLLGEALKRQETPPNTEKLPRFCHVPRARILCAIEHAAGRNKRTSKDEEPSIGSSSDLNHERNQSRLAT
jgi:hypothetical protein